MAVMGMTTLCLALQGDAAEVSKPVLPDSASITLTTFLTEVEELKRLAQRPEGYRLEADQIDWILEAEADLGSRGIKVPGEGGRLRLIGESYLNQGAYDLATEFFLRASDRCRFEAAFWLWQNHALRLPDQVQMAQVGGEPPPECGTVSHRLQTAREQFVAFRAGSVFRYEKRSNAHTVIFVTPDRSTWPARLAWEDRKLKITLRNGQRYRFDERTSTLESLPNLGVHRSGHARSRSPKTGRL